MKSKPTRYRVSASRDELRLEVDEHTFWDDTILAKDGTTQLDLNIAAVVEEIKAALYYVGTDTTSH